MAYNRLMTKQDVEPKEKWKISEPFPKSYLKGSSFSSLEKQLLFNREIKDEKEADEFLNPRYENLHDPFLLKGMKETIDRIGQALENKEKVVVYGDYDVDGITATVVLHETLNELGLDCGYYIPKRDEGYGLNAGALDEIKKRGVELVVTVDCGISSVDEVEYATKIGMDIVITDHHSIREEKGKQVLPKAVVINPRQVSCKYPYKELAGVGIAYKLSQALYKKFADILMSGQEKWLLDLVALGTVCDVVPLIGENRTLVHFGTKVIQKTKRIGIQFLTEVSGLALSEISSYKMGFQLGPRLNAAGRMETAEKSIRLLLTKDKNEARMLALDLNKFNQERQELTQRILKEAISEIEKKSEKAKIYLLKNKNWPSGVVGIIASKLTEKYFKPVILFEDRGDECQGSARSPKCFSIIEALEEASEHIVRYGGHARAAGLTVKKEHFILLENKLLEISGDKIKEEDLVSEYKIDSDISLPEVNGEVYSMINKMEPFGMGNPMPVFVAENIQIKNAKKVGKNFEHLKLAFTSDKVEVGGIYFSFKGDGFDTGDTVDIVFNITENIWAGRVNYEMRCISLRMER